MMTRFATLMISLILAGCSMMPASEPKDLYTLPSMSVPLKQAMDDGLATEASSLSDRILRVRTPHADRLTASQRILVHPGSGHLQAYKGARWSDTPPRMVRDYLVHALRSHADVTRVVSDEGSPGVDVELETDLVSFRVDYVDAQPVVRIELDALLMDAGSRDILAGRRFRVSQEVGGKEVPEVVRAFGQAMVRLTTDLIAWLEDAPSK